MNLEETKQDYLNQLADQHLGRLECLDKLAKQLDGMQYDAEDTEPEYSEGYAAAVASLQGWVEMQLHEERTEYDKIRKARKADDLSGL